MKNMNIIICDDRIDDRKNLFKIIKGCDPECIVWMPDKKPDNYFW